MANQISEKDRTIHDTISQRKHSNSVPLSTTCTKNRYQHYGGRVLKRGLIIKGLNCLDFTCINKQTCIKSNINRFSTTLAKYRTKVILWLV